MIVKIKEHFGLPHFIIATSDDPRFKKEYGEFHSISTTRKWGDLKDIENWAHDKYDEPVKFVTF